jgi:hypothetical protein
MPAPADAATLAKINSLKYVMNNGTVAAMTSAISKYETVTAAGRYKDPYQEQIKKIIERLERGE